MKCPDCHVQVPDTANHAYDFLNFLIAHVGEEGNGVHRLPTVEGWDQTPVHVECRQCGDNRCDFVDPGNDICVSCYEDNGGRFADND